MLHNSIENILKNSPKIYTAFINKKFIKTIIALFLFVMFSALIIIIVGLTINPPKVVQNGLLYSGLIFLLVNFICFYTGKYFQQKSQRYFAEALNFIDMYGKHLKESGIDQLSYDKDLNKLFSSFHMQLMPKKYTNQEYFVSFIFNTIRFESAKKDYILSITDWKKINTNGKLKITFDYLKHFIVETEYKSKSNIYFMTSNSKKNNAEKLGNLNHFHDKDILIYTNAKNKSVIQKQITHFKKLITKFKALGLEVDIFINENKIKFSFVKNNNFLALKYNQINFFKTTLQDLKKQCETDITEFDKILKIIITN